MPSLFGGFSVDKLKPNLKMSMTRIDIVKNKKENSQVRSKREIAQMLSEGKAERARIKTEHVVRDDFTIEAYDTISLLVELCLERVKLIESEKECPYDMREAVTTLMWAAERCEIPELETVAQQFEYKYGKEFAKRAKSNVDGSVNERVVQRLSNHPPNAFVVMTYMKEIAASNDVEWEPDEATALAGARFDVPMAAPTGASVVSGAGSGITAPYHVTTGALGSSSSAEDAFGYRPRGPTPIAGVSGGMGATARKGGDAWDVNSLPMPGDSIATPPKKPASGTSSTTTAPSGSDAVPDFDELTRRFEALKGSK